MVAPLSEQLRVFKAEYERINAEVYQGALPEFPGVVLTDSREIFAATNTRGTGRWRRLQAFLVSTHVTGPLLLEAARHEIAHAAALLFDEDEGHGPAWEEHARRCGARIEPTLDQGDPLRDTWDKL